MNIYLVVWLSMIVSFSQSFTMMRQKTMQSRYQLHNNLEQELLATRTATTTTQTTTTTTIIRSSTTNNNNNNNNNNDNNNDDDSPYIMVNGMPGPMATAAAEACLRKGLRLSPIAMTGPNVPSQIVSVTDSVTGKSTNVRLIPSNDTTELQNAVTATQKTVGQHNLLAIDYTHPSAVNNNAQFYVHNKIPFVMGTTGGNREQLMEDVQDHFCVIAPNMAKQIVAVQYALEELSKKYPASFRGYTLDVIESHQKTKADTSGTAKAIVDSIKVLADLPNYTYDDIRLIRTDEESMNFGVPVSAMNGHAFHTYTLSSPDNTVQFVLQHNVAGRTIYAEGTADAVKFLSEIIRTDPTPRVFTMMDVLEAGAL